METEAVEQNKVPTAAGVHQFESRSSIVCASVAGGTVEVAGRIEDQAGRRTVTVGLSLEVVENLLTAEGGHAEHRAMVQRAAIASRAIEVAGGVGNQSALGNV